MVRIGYAAVLLCMFALGAPQLRMWYGESGVLPYELSRTVAEPGWTVFTWLPATDATVYVCYGVMTLQALLLLLGCWSRLQALCLYGWLLSFHHRNPLILDAEDGLLRVVGFLVLCMPIGHSLGIDAWRKGQFTAVTLRPVWALRLLQIEACLVFAGSALAKLQSPDWLDGTALYYVSRLDDLFGRLPTPSFVWESMALLKATTWAVIAIEATVPVLVWFRETRWLALALALALHLAIDYSMNLFAFHWIMLVAWSSFVRSEEWRALGRKLMGRLGGGTSQPGTKAAVPTG
jgi:hypothetical protein